MGQKFGAGILVAVSKTDSQGNLLAVPQAYRLGILHEVSSEISFESKPLHGAYALPVDNGRGKAKLTFTAKSCDIKAAALAALHFGVTPSTGYKATSVDQTGTIPATPFQITPVVPSSGTWVMDLGVRDANGNDMTRVASAPATGQYSVSAGVYTFAAADTGKAVFITYEYSVASSGILVPLTNQLMGYCPSFQCMLYNDTKANKLAVKLTNCQSDKLSLPFKNDDWVEQDFSWQAYDDGTGSAGYVSSV